MREGKIERAIREHLAANPDEAFSTHELCAVCYPNVPRVALAGSETFGRKHRVAVLRAARKVLLALPDWRAIQANGLGPMLVFFNAASVPSTAKADFMRRHLNSPGGGPEERWDEPKRLADAERAVGEHFITRHGTDEQRRQLTDRKAAELALRAAKVRLAGAVARNPMGVLPTANRAASSDMKELAEKARALMAENDPDAIREGLAEIATALDGIAVEAENSMARVQEMLA